MSWAEFKIRLFAYDRLEKKEWYKLRFLAYENLKSTQYVMNSKAKIPRTPEKYLALEHKKGINKEAREKLLKAREEYIKRKNG